MKNHKKHLTDIDLQLYLAHALPWSKSVLIWFLLRLNRDMRGRMARIKNEHEEYLAREYPRLKQRLRPHFDETRRRARPVPVSTETDNAFIFRLPVRGPWRLAAGFAVVLLLAVGIYVPLQLDKQNYYAAKGSSLGVHLFVKGKETRRVEEYAVRLSPSDTLQIIPVGPEEQFLTVYAWESGKELVQLFPESGHEAIKVSKENPPPAIIPDSITETRLICVTSFTRQKTEKIHTLLSEKPFSPMKDAPSSSLHKNIYVQIYTLKGTEG